MSACSTCGKCPCYEHGRKTVMVSDTSERMTITHEALAELRRLEREATAGPNGDSLAAQLEAERSARLAAESAEQAYKKVGEGYEANGRKLIAEKKAAEAKLQAAESEWERALCKAQDERNVAILKAQSAESIVAALLDGFDHSSVCMVGDNCPDGEHKPDCPLVTQGYVATDGKRTAAGEALRGRPPPPPVPATTHELAVKVVGSAHRYRVAVAADRFHREGPVTASVAEAWLALGEAIGEYDRGAAFRRIPMRSVVYRCKAHAAPGEVLTIGYVKATCAVCGVEFKPEDGGGPQWVDGYSEQAYDRAATGDDAGKENG